MSLQADEENQLKPRTSQQDHITASTTVNSGTNVSSNGQPRDNTDSLVLAARDELIYSDSASNTVVNVATLQRMLLLHLQLEIIKKVGPLAERRFGNRNPLDDLKTDLADYAQAVRDWDFMAEYQGKSGGDPSRDPFCISSSSKLMDKAMKDARLHPVIGYASGPLDKLAGAFGRRTLVNRDRGFKALLQRLAMALFGGLALVAPMLLMVLQDDRTTALSTTSVAVFLFATVVAKFSNAAPEAIVGAVAAYAAVLVVFVGAHSS